MTFLYDNFAWHFALKIQRNSHGLAYATSFFFGFLLFGVSLIVTAALVLRIIVMMVSVMVMVMVTVTVVVVVKVIV